MAPLVLACIVLLIIIIVALLFYANDRKVEKLTANPAADVPAYCSAVGGRLNLLCNYCSSGTPDQRRKCYNFINAYAAIENSLHTPTVKQFGDLLGKLTYTRKTYTQSQLQLYTTQMLNLIENNALFSNFIKSAAQLDQAYILKFLTELTAKWNCDTFTPIKTASNSAIACAQLAKLSPTLSNEFTKVANLCQSAFTLLLKYNLCPDVARTKK
jgi:hypothetical protein